MESGFLPRLRDLLGLIQIPREAFSFRLMLDMSNGMFLLRQQRITHEREWDRDTHKETEGRREGGGEESKLERENQRKRKEKTKG